MRRSRPRRGSGVSSGPARVGAPAALVLALAASPVAAQSGGQADGERPGVFLDCASRNCNLGYFRAELPWVNWVRLPDDSDVYVIMTSQTTGAGGREYNLDFSGAGDFAYESRFVHRSLPTDTQREVLDELARTIGVGVLHFATLNGFLDVAADFHRATDALDVASEEFDPGERILAEDEVDDAWNFWVFRVGGGTEIDGEKTRRTKRVDGYVSASRVTPTWKTNFRGNLNFNQRSIDLDDDDAFVDTRTDWGFSHLIAYALAGHWSVGVQGEARRITRYNQRFRVEVAPALEYSFFPYREATRRAFTIAYRAGPAHRRYIEPTAFGRMEETRWEQALELELSQRQQWGDASIRMAGSHFLHDAQLYNVSLRGDVGVRVARGVEVNAEANVSWVNDQIYLPAEGATDAEALLNLQQRSQDFNYGVEAGFSFQFGSIYNNVVNNRFGDGRGGFR